MDPRRPAGRQTAQCRQCGHTHQTKRLRPLAEREDHAEASELRARLLADRAGELQAYEREGPYWDQRERVDEYFQRFDAAFVEEIETTPYRDRFAELVDCSLEAYQQRFQPQIEDHLEAYRDRFAAPAEAVLGDVVDADDPFAAYYGTDREPTTVEPASDHTLPKTDAGRVLHTAQEDTGDLTSITQPQTHADIHIPGVTTASDLHAELFDIDSPLQDRILRPPTPERAVDCSNTSANSPVAVRSGLLRPGGSRKQGYRAYHLRPYCVSNHLLISAMSTLGDEYYAPSTDHRVPPADRRPPPTVADSRRRSCGLPRARLLQHRQSLGRRRVDHGRLTNECCHDRRAMHRKLILLGVFKGTSSVLLCH